MPFNKEWVKKSSILRLASYANLMKQDLHIAFWFITLLDTGQLVKRAKCWNQLTRNTALSWNKTAEESRKAGFCGFVSTKIGELHEYAVNCRLRFRLQKVLLHGGNETAFPNTFCGYKKRLVVGSVHFTGENVCTWII